MENYIIYENISEGGLNSYIHIECLYLYDRYYGYRVTIRSYLFSCQTEFFIYEGDIEDTIKQIDKVIKDSSGEVIFHDGEGYSTIKFKLLSPFEVKIIGYIESDTSDEQSTMTFTMDADQTIFLRLKKALTDICY